MKSEIQLLCVIFFLKVWFFDHELTHTHQHRTAWAKQTRVNNTYSRTLTHAHCKQSCKHTHTNTHFEKQTDEVNNATTRAVKNVSSIWKLQVFASFRTHVSVLVLSSITHTHTQTSTKASKKAKESRQKDSHHPSVCYNSHTSHTQTQLNNCPSFIRFVLIFLFFGKSPIVRILEGNKYKAN